LYVVLLIMEYESSLRFMRCYASNDTYTTTSSHINCYIIGETRIKQCYGQNLDI